MRTVPLAELLVARAAATPPARGSIAPPSLASSVSRAPPPPPPPPPHSHRRQRRRSRAHGQPPPFPPPPPPPPPPSRPLAAGRALRLRVVSRSLDLRQQSAPSPSRCPPGAPVAPARRRPRRWPRSWLAERHRRPGRATRERGQPAPVAPERMPVPGAGAAARVARPSRARPASFRRARRRHASRSSGSAPPARRLLLVLLARLLLLMNKYIYIYINNNIYSDIPLSIYCIYIYSM